MNSIDSMVSDVREFIGASTALGGKARARIDRKELIARLDRQARAARSAQLLWSAMIVVTFLLTVLVAVFSAMGRTVVVPAGGVTLGTLIWRVERRMRERERLSIVLEIALQEPDDDALRELMVRLRDSVLQTTHERALSKTTPAPQPTTQRNNG